MKNVEKKYVSRLVLTKFAGLQSQISFDTIMSSVHKVTKHEIKWIIN